MVAMEPYQWGVGHDACVIYVYENVPHHTRILYHTRMGRFAIAYTYRYPVRVWGPVRYGT